MMMAINYVLPFFSRELIDNGFIKAEQSCIIRSALIILALNTAVAVINILMRKQSLIMSLGVKAKLQKDVFQHLLKIRISYFNEINPTSTFNCIEEDVNNISSIVSHSTISAITAIFSAVGGGIALFMIDWHLGLTVVLFTPFNIIFSEVYANKNNELISNAIRIKRKYSNWYGEALNGVREIRLFGLQKQKTDEMNEQVDKLNDLMRKSNMVLTCNTQIQQIITEVLKALIYILAGWFMVRSGLSVGSVVAFQAYMLMVSGSEAMIIGLFFSVFSLMPHIKRYYDFIDEPEERSACEHIDFTDGAIEFRNVDFAYDELGKKVFSNVNISLEHGSKTVIVGENGAGKTTFLNLLLSFLEPVSGDILVNGKCVFDIDLDEYRNLFSVVSQDIFLFHDTLKNNICLGKNISQDKLDEIIRDVNLEGVIDKYGLDYKITNNGSNLSGGQKQKIALARALVMERPVLLFDEATANLDRMSIRSFIELFKSRLKDTTVICVSHSDEIIDSFNSRMIFSDGSIRMEKCQKKYQDNAFQLS